MIPENNKTYHHQTKSNMTSWIKISEISDTSISYIQSINLYNIIDINIESKSNFMEICYYHRNSMNIFCYHRNLDDILSEKEKSKYKISWFNTYQEEINGDFNGDIELWMRSHRIESRWVMRDRKTEYITLNLEYFLANIALLVPFINETQFFEIMGEKYSGVFPYINAIFGSNLKTLQRNLIIDEILEF